MGDLGISLVSNFMSRNRFTLLKSYIHLNDNTKLNNETSNDKAFKIRPLLESVSQSFSKYGVFDDILAVDEMIVKHCGRHNMK